MRICSSSQFCREMSDEWLSLLSKLRECLAAGDRNEQGELLHSLVQGSLELENRKSVDKCDVEMMSQLLSDWSERYRDELAQITPTLLTGATPTSCIAPVLNVIKLLRNLCAGVPLNQANILCTNVLMTLLSLITILTEHSSHRLTHTHSQTLPATIVTTILQLLGNLCVGYPKGQAHIWETFFPQSFKSLLDTYNADGVVCMILHACTCMEGGGDTRRKDLLSTSEGLNILTHIVSSPNEDSTREWRSIFMRSFLKLTPLQVLHDCLGPSRPALWPALLELAVQLMEERGDGREEEEEGVWLVWDEGECVYLVTVWRGDVESVLANEAAILKACRANEKQTVPGDGYQIVTAVRAALRALCSLSVRQTTLTVLQKQDLLLDSAVALLRQLSVLDGSAYSGQHRSTLTEASLMETPQREASLFGLKRDLLQLISSLLYRCRHMQDKLRDLDKVPLLLNQCHIDHSNPYIMQWVILAIRNLCEDNPANQQLIAQMESQGVAETASQLEFGCKVQIGSDGKLKIKPKCIPKE